MSVCIYVERFFICSSLGKPRRFSNHFLAAEKEKLEDYRENVRKYYAELSDGLRDSLPTDLARPFSVGQHVIVRHPSTRELADGEVVMAERDCYKVQFDRPDLGVDIIKVCICYFGFLQQLSVLVTFCRHLEIKHVVYLCGRRCQLLVFRCRMEE